MENDRRAPIFGIGNIDVHLAYIDADVAACAKISTESHRRTRSRHIAAFSSYVLIVNIPDLSAHLFQLEKRIVVFPVGDLRPDTVSIGYLGNAFRPFT